MTTKPPEWGDARAKQLLALVSDDDCSILDDLFANLRDGAWDDRTFYADTFGSQLPLSAVDAWCEREPGNAVARLLRGRCCIETAAEVRGGRTVDKTSSKALRGFEEWLVTAEEDLLEAASMDPSDPTPFAFRIRVMQGTGRGSSDAPAQLEAIRARDPRHYWGHHAMLMASTAKWGGSHDQMFAVARTAEPGGGLLPFLIVNAHLERWIGFMMSGDNRGAAQYGADPTVRSEIARAVDAAYKSGALVPNAPAAALPLNTLAFWAHMARDVELLRWAIELVDTTLTPYPWSYLDGVETFEDARDAVKS